MTVTERTLSPEQRALLLTILSDVVAIRNDVDGLEDEYNAHHWWGYGAHVYTEARISERLDAIARKVREINGGGQA